MKVHLWDNGIVCGTTEDLTRSSSERLNVTCPDCLNKKVEPVKGVDLAVDGEGDFTVIETYAAKEPLWAHETLMRQQRLDAEFQKVLLGGSDLKVDLDYARSLRRVADKNVFRIIDEIEAEKDKYATITLDSLSHDLRKDIAKEKAAYDKAYKESFLPAEADDDDLNYKPCHRCGGSGTDPTYFNNDPVTGEAVPVECEACAARRWDQENLNNY